MKSIQNDGERQIGLTIGRHLVGMPRADDPLARLSRRLGTPQRVAWSPPPLPAVIERIEAALAARRR